MTVSWNRGLFRVWIVFAVIWIGAAGWMLYGPSPSPAPDSLYQYDPYARAMSERELFFLEAKRAAWVFGPPILALFGGLAALWTIRGFRD